MYDPIVSRSSHKEKATRSGGMALFFTFCICYGLGKAIYSMSVDLYALIAWIFKGFDKKSRLVDINF